MSDAPNAAPAAPVSTSASTETAAPDTSLDTAEGLLAAEEAAESDTAPSKAEAPKSNKKKFQLKVDGQDYEEELDLSNDEELRKHLQMSKAAQKRMKETADLRTQQQLVQNQIAEFINHLRDPKKAAQVLSDPRIGMDVKAFAQQILNQEVEDMQKSPEQKEREKIQAELEQLKAEKEQAAKQADEERRTRLQTEYASELNNDIEAALTKHNLPKKPYIIRRIAEQLMTAIENGITDVKVDDVAPFVYRQWKQDIREAMDGSPEEMIEQLIGADTVDKLRKYRIRNMKKSVATPSKIKDSVNQSEASSSSAKKEPKSHVNMHSFFRNLK